MLDETRPCASRSRKPNRYTKHELELLVRSHRLPIVTANKTIDELCKHLKEYPLKKLKRMKALALKKAEMKKKKENQEAYKKREMERKKKLLQIKKQKQLIKKILEEKKKQRLKKQKKEADEKKKKNCILRSTVPLRDYQRKVIRFMNKNNRLLVYFKMGTGKTLTAVAVSQCFLDKNPTKSVLVVTPASLLDNFRQGMVQYGNIRHPEKYEFLSIQKCTSLLKQGKLNCADKLVIIDEAHNYKADIRINKRTGNIISGKNIFEGYKCFLHAEKLLLLTGTPLYNSMTDLNVYKVLLNYQKNDTRPILDIIKEFKKESIDILKCKISTYSFENDSESFPARVDKTVKILMNPAYENEYQKILMEIEKNAEKHVISRVFKNYTDSNTNQFLNLTRRATQNIDNNLTLNRKLNYVKHLIERYAKRNEKLSAHDKYKIVVYSQFKDHGINLIKNVIDVRSATISGDTKVSERSKIVNLYNEGKITVLFLTKAGGEGLDLKGTDSIVLMEPTWNNNTSEQVIGRAIRFQSHATRPEDRKKVKVYRLCHVTNADTTENTIAFLKTYIRNAKLIVPSVNSLLDTIRSCDLIMETYQTAKQKVLDHYDQQLKALSIENNDC